MEPPTSCGSAKPSHILCSDGGSGSEEGATPPTAASNAGAVASVTTARRAARRDPAERADPRNRSLAVRPRRRDGGGWGGCGRLRAVRERVFGNSRAGRRAGVGRGGEGAGGLARAGIPELRAARARVREG